MYDPYSRYPHTWKKFTLEQCEEMSKELNKTYNVLGIEKTPEEKVAINANYFGLIPIICVMGVFGGGYYSDWITLLFGIPAISVAALLVYCLGVGAYKSINRRKAPSAFASVVQVVAAYAICWFAARILFGMSI